MSSSNPIIFLIFCLVSVAFLTLLERKFLGLVGSRPGPNKVSFTGLLQPVTDALKLSCKEGNSSGNFNYWSWYCCSVLSLLMALSLWLTSFSSDEHINPKFSLVWIMIILSLMSIFCVLVGWSSYSKMCVLGSIRGLAQIISYEGSLYLCMFLIATIYSSLNYRFYTGVCPNILFLPFLVYFWLPSILAELNRSPFDFSEGESELVSGFNTELGSFCFTMFFLSEYSNILFFSFLTSLFFFGFFFFFYSFFFLLIILMFRASCPRFRFDSLMDFCWKTFIPLLTLIFFFLFFFIT